MGLFDFFKGKKKDDGMVPPSLPKKKITYADSSTVAEDEKPFYLEDEYYVYSINEWNTVITFEKRKKISYPSKNGLYVGEILLLDYCKTGKYPKPAGGYPAFWWFEYGIRDIGHALESLEQRGFIQWGSIEHNLKNLNLEQLKEILSDEGLYTGGKKADLISRIAREVPESRIENYLPSRKYELTELGVEELEQNEYVPYMHKSDHAAGDLHDRFNVWVINQKFSDGDTSKWRSIVGNLERQYYGVNMAKSYNTKETKKLTKQDYLAQREDVEKYLESKKDFIKKKILEPGDGFEEEMKGIDLKKAKRDKEALVQFFIAIGKRFDMPALYSETVILLRKYGMYEDELNVIDTALKVVNANDEYKQTLEKRKEKVIQLINKRND